MRVGVAVDECQNLVTWINLIHGLNQRTAFETAGLSWRAQQRDFDAFPSRPRLHSVHIGEHRIGLVIHDDMNDEVGIVLLNQPLESVEQPGIGTAQREDDGGRREFAVGNGRLMREST